MKQADLYFYSDKMNLSSCLYFMFSPPGPPGGRRRMGRINHGGGPNAPPMGGWGRWVFYWMSHFKRHRYNIHCNFYFSAGKCLHIQCRRGAWYCLHCRKSQCWSSFLLAAAALSSFMMPVWEFLHVGARLTDAAATDVTCMLQLSWHRFYDYIWLFLCLDWVLFRLDKTLLNINKPLC